MKQPQCPHCQSYALLRIKRTTLLKFRYPNSRRYRCHECTTSLLINKTGQIMHSKDTKFA
ncbi:MAG: hypothetical protein ACPGF7_07660 [Pontibacterium sp.]